MTTIEELADMEECPCNMCCDQGDQDILLEQHKMNEACDFYSNYLIDYLLENHKKDILKRKDKENTVK